MESHYSDSAKRRALHTLISIEEAIQQLIEWNENVNSTDDFACSPTGMQLLAANAMLITAIGEGINTINSKLPSFLDSYFPEIQWHAIKGMRNRIVHGYFSLDAGIVFDVIKNDIPALQNVIKKAITIINENNV
ncbi:MAG: DUF86 domain-containing protein [Muribaculaceae bacterium]|nr:DUF86 domain-containing protein [Muribaculaceae bacterium]